MRENRKWTDGSIQRRKLTCRRVWVIIRGLVSSGYLFLHETLLWSVNESTVAKKEESPPPRMEKGRCQKLGTASPLTPTLTPRANVDAVHRHVDLIFYTLPSLVIVVDQVTIWPQVKPILLPALQNSTWKKVGMLALSGKARTLSSDSQVSETKPFLLPRKYPCICLPRAVYQNGSGSRPGLHKHSCYTRVAGSTR